MDLRPPDHDEIEVSVFGPGYGESILLHLGSDNWIVVDSCIDHQTRQCLPLTYLKKLDVNPKKSVKMIIATHWHDDHIRGLFELFTECEDAQFVCSDALTGKEFLALILAHGKNSMMTDTGVNEFYNIFQALENRHKKFSLSPKWAIADRPLFKQSLNNAAATNIEVCLTALSPSDLAVLRTKQYVASLLKQLEGPRRRIHPPKTNDASVGLWITIGEVSILLGADLEQHGDGQTGWSAIIASMTRPNGKASVFKVPHHGAISSDNPIVWERMLEENPVAVLTPFKRGKNCIPSTEDVSRICARTNQAYSTALVTEKYTKRIPTITKRIKETVRSIRQIEQSKGQVRLRHLFTEPSWRIELFGDATRLGNLYSQLS